MDFSFTEVVGYAASIAVLCSFLLKDVKRLRIVNTIGCSIFLFYGVLLNFSIPIIITNAAIIIINMFYLVKMQREFKQSDTSD